MDPTRRLPLGKIGVTVTSLGLGGVPLGGLYHPVDEGEAPRIVRRAWEMGTGHFDNHPFSGHGEAERRMGRVLGEFARAEFTLATKVGRLLRDDVPLDWRLRDGRRPIYRDVPPVQPVFDFSYDGVMRSFEASLERLGMDRVDI